MKRPSLASRDRRAILFGLLVLGPPLLYIGAIQPFAATIAEARERVAADRDALARERALLTLAPRSAAFRSALDSAVAATREQLFGARDDGIATAELSAYLGRLARQNEVWLRAADAGETTVTPSGVRVLPVEIHAESDFEGLLAFLRAMEKGTKLLRVNELAITPSADTSVSSRALELRAMVTGYALVETAAPAPALVPDASARVAAHEDKGRP